MPIRDTGVALSSSGIITAANWGALPAATGSGAQRLVLDRGQAFTDVTVEDMALWLPDRAIRDAAGALRTLTWSRDTGGEKCRLRPGDTVPAGWTLGGGSTAGSISTAGGKVSLTGYLYTDVADNDAALTILVMQLHSASAFANANANNNVGVFAGNNNAGNAMVGLRVRGTSSTPPLDVGYYNNSIGKGRAQTALVVGHQDAAARALPELMGGRREQVAQCVAEAIVHATVQVELRLDA